MKKHFVTFLSPGTFIHEESIKPISSWNVKKAVKLSRNIIERYNAKPFCFYFTTRERKDDELDSKEVKRSCRYYLGGKVETLEEVQARNDPKEEILLSNMICNGYNRIIIINTNSWKITQPFEDDDVVLEYP